MKRISAIFFAATVAAFSFVSCSQENLATEEKPQGGLVTVHFGAESSIASTKATLTTEDEATFKSAWENGDVLSVEYSIDDQDNTKDVVEATWQSSSRAFEAELPMYEGTWMYDVIYPAPVSEEVYFGSERTQKGNNYNGKYDLMRGSAIVENAVAGKDDDGKNVVFNMERQTAIAYFHLTGELDEEVVSATLSVEGETAAIASSLVMALDYKDGFDLSTEDLKEIKITFDKGTAPKASDIKLWFNVLPTEYTSMKLEVETAGHKLTLSNKKQGSYAAANLYKVVKKISSEQWVAKKTVGWELVTDASSLKEGDDIVLASNTNDALAGDKSGDYLQKVTATFPEDVSFMEDIPDGALVLTLGVDNDSWIFQNEDGDKLGSTGAKKLAWQSGTTSDKFSSSWTISINEDNAASIEVSTYGKILYNVNSPRFLNYTSNATNAMVLPQIYRYVGPKITVNQTSKTWASDATDAFVINVKVNGGASWNVTPETLDWAKVEVDKAAGTITVTPNGKNETSTANEATLTVTHATASQLSKTVTLKQIAAGSTVESKTSTLTLSPTNKFLTGTSNTLKADDNVVWTVTTNTGAIQNSYQSAYCGQQFGTGDASWTGSFAADFSGKKISKIEITANTGGSATVSATVGNSAFGESVSVAKKTGQEVVYTFEGLASGKVSLVVSATSKAFYLGKIKVTYTE